MVPFAPLLAALEQIPDPSVPDALRGALPKLKGRLLAGAIMSLGEFAVQYKMPVARFRGVNVTGSSYDIPDVKWVMSFLGDYTIHGVYWRSGFGRPGSNGCVGLTDANAKLVYDWAPEGTLVRIHF